MVQVTSPTLSRRRLTAWGRPDSASSNGSTESRDGRGTSARRKAPAVKLPREGAPGNGRFVVTDATLLGKLVDSLEGMNAETTRNDLEYMGGAATTSMLMVDDVDDEPFANGDGLPATGNQVPSVLTMTRRFPSGRASAAELNQRREALEKQRQQDQTDIQLKLETRKQYREDRFQRMFKEVMGFNSIRYDAAMKLREWEANNENRRCGMYNDWDEKVYEPIARQADEHVNGARAEKQRVLGKKSVDFRLPGEGPKAYLHGMEDPLKQQHMEQAKEDAFVHESEGFFCQPSSMWPRSGSAPSLTAPVAGAPGRIGAGYTAATHALSAPPLARSRPVLEPMDWNPVRLQGLLCGRGVARAAEEGVGFRRTRRGGYAAHTHDETDGVVAAGKICTRTLSTGKEFNDLGTLKAAQRKTLEGISSGAPVQDHFTFSRGREVADLEFPLGKKVDYPRI